VLRKLSTFAMSPKVIAKAAKMLHDRKKMKHRPLDLPPIFEEPLGPARADGVAKAQLSPILG